jgi:hypothetical protein
MKLKTILFVALITLVIAQVNAQSISIGPQVGYYKAQDADQGSLLGGVACRIKLGPALGVEASINYRHEKYADGLVTVRSWPVMATGLFYPLPIVYGAMGAGWYNVTIDYDQSRLPFLTDQTVQKFGWHFGAGLELPIGTAVKLTGDIRYVFLNYGFKTLPGSGDPKSNFTVITAGMLFTL